MKQYEILPHTADAKFRAYGRTLEEAFGNAALAMASLMWDWTKIEPEITHHIRASGKDREQLLVNFLSEIVYLLDTQRFLLAGVDRPRIREEGGLWNLETVLSGDSLSDRYEVYGDVKAVTYSDMKIEEGDGFAVQVVVDM
jgi:SHS2 domain-containing protein